MAFSDYENIGQVQREYRIRYREENFIPSVRLTPAATFIEEFAFNQANLDFSTDAARATVLAFPILREVYKRHHDSLALWIQQPITCDEKLSGTPAYLLATKSALGKTVLEQPLVLVAEAKKNDFEQGWGECLTQLIAAQKLSGNAGLPVFGVVTDGVRWQFGKLLHNEILLNIKVGLACDIAGLFGMLDFIFQAARESANAQNGSARPIHQE